jgi:hypothetical protein
MPKEARHMQTIAAAHHCNRSVAQLTLVAMLALLVGARSAGGQEIAIEARFEMAGVFHEGAAPVQVGGRWGLIDHQGNWIVKPTYDQVGPGGEGLFPFQQDGKWGYVEASGTQRVGARYEEAKPFDDGVAPVKLGGLWGLLKPDGSLEVDFRFEEIGGHEGRYISARDAEGWAVFQDAGSAGESRDDLQMELYTDGGTDGTLPLRLYSISEGAVVAAYPDGERLIDLAIRKPFRNMAAYYSVRRRSEGLAAAASKADSWSFIDKSGYTVWYFDAYQDAMIFSEGLAPVKRDGRWGYIDRSGGFVIEPRYDAAHPVRDGYAIVRAGDKRGFLKNDFEQGLVAFIEPQYDDASRFSEGLAPVRIGDKWGYVADRSGKVIDGEIIDVNAK